MKPIILRLGLAVFPLLFIGLIFVGCDDALEAFDVIDSDASTDADTDTDVDTDSDADADSDTDTDTDVVIPMSPVPAQVVLLLDTSGSMSGTPLADAKSAINSILTLWAGLLEFGFDYFPVDANCGVNTSIPIPPANGSEAAATTMLNGLAADGLTPLYDAMDNYNGFGYATGFPDPAKDSYLLVFTDGHANCDESDPYAFASLTAGLYANGMHTMALGFNYQSTQLDLIAANGGMQPPYDQPLLATDQASLQSALNTMASGAFTCHFTVDDPSLLPSFDYLNIYLDGVQIPKRNSCAGQTTGWAVADAGNWEIEFCPETCDDFKDGSIPTVTATVSSPE